jgi:hypothetical protein
MAALPREGELGERGFPAPAPHAPRPNRGPLAALAAHAAPAQSSNRAAGDESTGVGNARSAAHARRSKGSNFNRGPKSYNPAEECVRARDARFAAAARRAAA